MKDFELKKIKHYPQMSEETECFSAELWVDNKHVANIKNVGQGGSNDFHPITPLTYEDVKEFDTLDAECAIYEKLMDMIEVKKSQSKAFVLKKGNDIYLAKFKEPFNVLKQKRNYKTWLKIQLDHFAKKGYQVLNTNL